jgi:hypothetical protein
MASDMDTIIWIRGTTLADDLWRSGRPFGGHLEEVKSLCIKSCEDYDGTTCAWDALARAYFAGGPYLDEHLEKALDLIARARLVG